MCRYLKFVDPGSKSSARSQTRPLRPFMLQDAWETKFGLHANRNRTDAIEELRRLSNIKKHTLNLTSISERGNHYSVRIH